MDFIKNLQNLNNEIKQKKNIKLIVVTKSQDLEKVEPIIQTGHNDFGENRVIEAKKKWEDILSFNKGLNLHLIGHLQTNKAKEAVSLFNYIHTLDSEKLAKILSTEEKKKDKKIKYFIQVNIGNEVQKTGITLDQVHTFKEYCLNVLKLNIIGLMCIPPAGQDPSFFFNKLSTLAKEENLSELSMGMSDDYKIAMQHGATYLRIGRTIFGERS